MDSRCGEVPERFGPLSSRQRCNGWAGRIPGAGFVNPGFFAMLAIHLQCDTLTVFRFTIGGTEKFRVMRRP